MAFDDRIRTQSNTSTFAPDNRVERERLKGRVTKKKKGLIDDLTPDPLVEEPEIAMPEEEPVPFDEQPLKPVPISVRMQQRADAFNEWLRGDQAEPFKFEFAPDSSLTRYSLPSLDSNLPDLDLTNEVNLSSAEALNFGYTIPASQKLKIVPQDTGEPQVFISDPVHGDILFSDLLAQQELRLQKEAEMLAQLEQVNANIVAIFPEEDLASLINSFTPADDSGQERARVDEAQDRFVAEMQTIGRNPDTVSLLKAVFPQITEEEVDVFFGINRVNMPLNGTMQNLIVDNENYVYNEAGFMVGVYNPITREAEELPTESWVKDKVLDPFYFAATEVWHKSEQFFLTVVPDLLFRDMTALERTIQGEAWADLTNERNQKLRDDFRWVATENMDEFHKWKTQHIDTFPNSQLYQEGVFKHPELLGDIGYIAYEMTSNAPFMIAMLVGGTIGNLSSGPIGAATMVTALATPVSTMETREALMAEGLSEVNASMIALPVGIFVASIEILGEIPMIRAVSPRLMGLAKRRLVTEIAALTRRQLIQKGITTFTLSEFSEMFEEVAQQAVQNMAVWLINHETSVFDKEEMLSIAARTGVATLGMSGSAGVLSGTNPNLRKTRVQVPLSQTIGKTVQQLEARGLWKDPSSNLWYEYKEVPVSGAEATEGPLPAGVELVAPRATTAEEWNGLIQKEKTALILESGLKAGTAFKAWEKMTEEEIQAISITDTAKPVPRTTFVNPRTGVEVDVRGPAVTELDRALESKQITPENHQLATYLVTKVDPNFDLNSAIEISDNVVKITKQSLIDHGFDPNANTSNFEIRGQTYITMSMPRGASLIDVKPQIDTAIRLYKGHDATTILEEWYHRGWYALSRADQLLFTAFHNVSLDKRSVEEHFAQDGVNFFFKEELNAKAGVGIFELFKRLTGQLFHLINEIRKLEGSRVPARIEAMWRKIGTHMDANELSPTSPFATAREVKTQQLTPVTRSFIKNLDTKGNVLSEEIKTVEVSMEPSLLNGPDNSVPVILNNFTEARSWNASPERVADFTTLYEKAEPLTKLGFTGAAADIGIWVKPNEKSKLAAIPQVSLTKGCQRDAVTLERVLKGLLPAETRLEACYGGSCFVNWTRMGFSRGFENMDIRALSLVPKGRLDQLLASERTQNILNNGEIIRMGTRGDDSHAIASGRALEWFQALEKYGVTTPTIMVSSGYAPVTQEQYEALQPYQHMFELHFSLSGWFHENEIMLRLAEFNAAREAGLNPKMRVITNASNISEMNFENEDFLLKHMRAMGIQQHEILETPFHDDRIKSRSKVKRSEPSEKFQNICCESGVCMTCGPKCMTNITNPQASVQTSYQLKKKVPNVGKADGTDKPLTEQLGEMLDNTRSLIGATKIGVKQLSGMWKKATQNIIKVTESNIRDAEGIVKRIAKGETVTDAELQRVTEKLEANNSLIAEKRGKLDEMMFVKKVFNKYLKGMPALVKAKELTPMKDIKTEEDMIRALDKVDILYEEYMQKLLTAKIQVNLKKARARVTQKLPKGRFTPDVQSELTDIERWLFAEKRLNDLTADVEAQEGTAEFKRQIQDRENVPDDIAANESNYDKGMITWGEFVEMNEVIKYRSIQMMDATQLQEVLDYIEELEGEGRAEKSAFIEQWNKEKAERNATFIEEITGGIELEAGLATDLQQGSVAKLIDLVENANYGFSELTDKITKRSGSEAYQSELNKYVDGTVRNAHNRQVELGEKWGVEVKAIAEAAFGRDMNDSLNRNQEDRINLGRFKNTDGVLMQPFRLTMNELITFRNWLKDSTLRTTFVDTMKWTDEVMDAINNAVTGANAAYADGLLAFYDRYYEAVNEVYREFYWVDLPRVDFYSPLFRDMGVPMPESNLLMNDAYFMASTRNPSLLSRTRSKARLRKVDANKTLINHVTQMNHFMAWTSAIKDLRSVFNDSTIQEAIAQKHGRNVLHNIRKMMDDLARGGMDQAKTINLLDKLRRNFAIASLAKTIIGVKQIFSQWAYLTQAPIADVVAGFGDFWTNPRKNHRFLKEHSPYYRQRFNDAAYERDMALIHKTQNPAKAISGKGNYQDWFMKHIRLGDKFAVTQGMWAVFKYNMKGKEWNDTNIKAAMIQAELATERSQPTSSIQSLSSWQRGGSWLKLLTMFSTQINKYYRLVSTNGRNVRYGRGSKQKAIFNMALVWVILPMLFQFVTDAFKWKDETQIPKILLGYTNGILIVGPMLQWMLGRLMGLPFEYQVSPVFSTFTDLGYALDSLNKMIDKGQDPLRDITGDDVIKMIEALAKAGGQTLGLPTPYLVQIERSIRRANKEEDPSAYLELLFSAWSLRPPEGDKTLQIESAFEGLGDLVILTPEEEKLRAEQMESGLTPPPLDVKTVNATDTSLRQIYRNVYLPSLLDDKSLDPRVRDWVEMELVRLESDILPNLPLYKIVEKLEETVLISLDDAIRNWEARSLITNIADLNEFDANFSDYDVTLGNLTSSQKSLMRKYEALEGQARKQFLADNEGLKVNPRKAWLEADPEKNAMLAAWGNADIRTQAAYALMPKFMDQYGFTEDMLPERTLPSPAVIDAHFEYKDALENFAQGSAEVQLILANNPNYANEMGLSVPESSIAELELVIAGRSMDNYRDFLYKDAETEEEKKEALDILKKHPNYREWQDNKRKIQAMKKGTLAEPTSDTIVNSWVEYGISEDTYGSGASETLVWFLDNMDTYKWAISNDLLTDRVEELTERDPVLRLTVKNREKDAEYDKVLDEINPLSGINRRTEFLALPENEEYRQDRRRKEAFTEGFPSGMVEKFVDYWEKPVSGPARAWYLIENPTFADQMHALKGTDIPSADETMSMLWYDIQEPFTTDFEKYNGMKDIDSKYYEIDTDKRAEKRGDMKIDPLGKMTDFGKAWHKLQAVEKFLPESHLDTYVEYQVLLGEHDPDKWFPEFQTKSGEPRVPWVEDEWFMQDNPAYHDEVWVGELGNLPFDFTRTPTPEVFDKYLEFLEMDDNPAIPIFDLKMFRLRNLDLDAWGVIRFNWVRIQDQKFTAPSDKPVPTHRQEFQEGIQDRIRDKLEGEDTTDERISDIAGRHGVK